MRIKRGHIVAALFVLTVILAWYFWDSPERAIRKLLRDGEAAVEAEDATRAMSHVSRQYRDGNGLNYLAVRRVLGFAFNRFDGIDVRLRDVMVDIGDGRATAKGQLQVLVVEQGENLYLIGEPGVPDLVVIALEKQRLAWKVISVNGIDVSRFGL
ncbi:MAG: hypothetical protein ACE5K1_09540 [Acidiferrobacterales bacterium]